MDDGLPSDENLTKRNMNWCKFFEKYDLNDEEILNEDSDSEVLKSFSIEPIWKDTDEAIEDKTANENENVMELKEMENELLSNVKKRIETWKENKFDFLINPFIGNNFNFENMPENSKFSFKQSFRYSNETDSDESADSAQYIRSNKKNWRRNRNETTQTIIKKYCVIKKSIIQKQCCVSKTNKKRVKPKDDIVIPSLSNENNNQLKNKTKKFKKTKNNNQSIALSSDEEEVVQPKLNEIKRKRPLRKCKEKKSEILENNSDEINEDIENTKNSLGNYFQYTLKKDDTACRELVLYDPKKITTNDVCSIKNDHILLPVDDLNACTMETDTSICRISEGSDDSFILIAKKPSSNFITLKTKE